MKLITYILLFLNLLLSNNFKDDMRLSYEYEYMNKPIESIKILIKYKEEKKKDYIYNNRLGMLLLKDKKYMDSLFFLKKAEKINEMALNNKLAIIDVNMLLGNVKKSIQLCFTLLKLYPNNYYVNLYTINILLKQKKIGIVKELIKKMLKIYPNDILMLERRFYICKNKRKKEEIKKQIRLLDPNNKILNNS